MPGTGASFTSRLYPGEVVIDDNNFMQHAPPQNVVIDGEIKGRGLEPRNYGANPEGSVAAMFDDADLEPRSNWRNIIEEQEKTNSRLSDIVLAKNIPSLDQDGTNYCWIHGVVTAMIALRAWMNEPYLKFSPAFGGAQIKGYRNQGGWGGDALEWIIKNGMCTEEFWPANQWSKKPPTFDQAVQQGLENLVTEWKELKARRFDQLMTRCVRRKPVAVGYNWWSHEVCGFDGVVLGNDSFGIRIRNSWTDSYGFKGFAVLTESKATPDDAVSPEAVLPST